MSDRSRRKSPLSYECDIEWLTGSTYEDTPRFACMVAFLKPVFGGKQLGESSPQTAIFERKESASRWDLYFANPVFAIPWLEEGAQLVLFWGSRCCGVATVHESSGSAGTLS